MHFPLQIEAGDPADYRRTVAGLVTSRRMVAAALGTVMSETWAELIQAPEKTRGERLGPFSTNDLIAAVASLLAMTGPSISSVV